MIVEDLRVPRVAAMSAGLSHMPRRGHAHHDLPGVYRQVRVTETPVELLIRDWFIRRVMIRREIGVRKPLAGLDPFPRVEHQHLLQQLDGLRVRVLEFVF